MTTSHEPWVLIFVVSLLCAYGLPPLVLAVLFSALLQDSQKARPWIEKLYTWWQDHTTNTANGSAHPAEALQGLVTSVVQHTRAASAQLWPPRS